jgi:hypothetical protein
MIKWPSYYSITEKGYFKLIQDSNIISLSFVDSRSASSTPFTSLDKALAPNFLVFVVNNSARVEKFEFSEMKSSVVLLHGYYAVVSAELGKTKKSRSDLTLFALVATTRG